MKQYLLGILLAVAACLGASQSALAQNSESIVDRLNTTLGVRLPAEYEAKVREFAANDTIMRTKSATAYTEQFLTEQMKNDWGISKQNQLLFMWSTIYEGISKKVFYNFLDDDNEARSDEYFNQLGNINQFYDRYKKGFKEYMEQKSAEYDRRTAEAQQHSMIMHYYGLYLMNIAYSLRNKAYESEIKTLKEIGERTIQMCKKYNIDYQSLLPVEVQKFYDISPVQQNSLTCDKAKANILNIVLREIVKLYNLYQQAPQDEREIADIKSEIDACKENNIDYRAVLRKELGDEKKVNELLKFLGVE